MEDPVQITSDCIQMEEVVMLTSPKNPEPIETVFLSNIDQSVAFPVMTLFFYKAPGGERGTMDIAERIKKAVSEDLLIPYYFLAGRLHRNINEKSRLELVCNNHGVYFVSSKSSLKLDDLGDVSIPNPSFQHFIANPGFKNLGEVPILSVQVTRFICGGVSIGFVSHHSILDGRSASEMLQNLASICRGEGFKTHEICNNRSYLRARNPVKIKYPHKEYVKFSEVTSVLSSFTSPNRSHPSSDLSESPQYTHKLFKFTPEMLQKLKEKVGIKCSTFEVMVAHIWRARTKAIFEDRDEISSVFFAVDIRSKINPPLPYGFTGNAVISAWASAKVGVLYEKPFSFCVEKIKQAISSITDEYIRSVIDWLEICKGIPAAINGNFYVSAWSKLDFHELDFGYGKPIHGGPIANGMNEFVILLSDGGKRSSGESVNVWTVLEKEKMQKFSSNIFIL